MENLFPVSLPAGVVIALGCHSGEGVVLKPVQGPGPIAVTGLAVFPREASVRTSARCAAGMDLATIVCPKRAFPSI